MNRHIKLEISILKSVKKFIEEVVVEKDIWEISELIGYIDKQIELDEKKSDQ